MIKQFYFKKFSFKLVIFLHSSTWAINRLLSVDTTPWSNGNEGVLYTTQSSNITGVSSSDGFVSYLGHFVIWNYRNGQIIYNAWGAW